MADNREIRIIIRYENAPAGTGAGNTGGSGGGGSSRTTNKANVFALLEEAKATENLTERKKLLNKAVTQLSKENDKYAGSIKALKGGINQLDQQIKKNANTWSNAMGSYQFKFNALGNIISNVVSQATQMLFQLGSSVVTISKDFEFSMSGVRAITNATDKEFKLLTNDAIRLGGSTLYTATEISKLQEELAKLGFSVQEIHEATDGVVALAQATGEDLSNSALTAGTMIRAFNLDASDLTGVVDVMAQAFNDSALDLYKFTETMKYVGPVASKTGFTITEVTAMMAKLADQGIIASQAGTGLRNIMLRMANANSALSKAMGGSARTLPEMIIGLEKLSKAGIDSTGMLKLLDRYSVTAGLALVQQTKQIWDMYESISTTTGAAEKMSETRMDNFAGEVEMLSGAWDSFILTINKGNGALRWFISGIRGALEIATEALKGTDQKASDAANKLMGYHKERLNDAIANIRKEQIAEEKLVVFSTELAETKYKKLKEIREKYALIVENEIKLDLESEINLANDKLKVFSDEMLAKLKIRNGYYQHDLVIFHARVSKKELEEATQNVLTYTKYLEDLRKSKVESDKKSQADQTLLTENEAKEAEEKADKEASLRLAAMEEGLKQELQANRNHYDKLRSEAQKEGILDIDFTRVESQKKAEIIKNWDKKILDEKIKIADAKLKFIADEVKAEEERQLKLAEIALDEYDFASYKARDIYRDRLKWIKDNITDEKESLLLKKSAYQKYIDDLGDIDKKRKADVEKDRKESHDELLLLLGKLEKEEPESVEKPLKKYSKDKNRDLIDIITQGLGIKDLTSEQKQALEKGFSFITDQLQKIADKEVEIADRRVESSQRVVDQLQQDLQTEIALAENGFASNVTLKRKELAEAKKAQAEALVLQKKALDDQRKMSAVLQAISLITASANTFEQFSKIPYVGIPLAIAMIGTMWGAFAVAQSKAKELTKYGSGGEIDGPKHSRGGTIVEAEGGEFMVKASAYNNHKDLVQAINNEDMANVYRALNQDLSVSLDDSNTARMLGKHFSTRKQTEYFNGYRIETIGNRRRTIRSA